MAQLAIRGHETRGKEVIELLEMLGGRSPHYFGETQFGKIYTGSDTNCFYYIKDDFYIGVFKNSSSCIIFTLEEFLEKFPYKVGDKVIDIKTNKIAEIYGAHWSVSNNCTYYDLKRPDNTGFVRSYKFLQPYKE